MNRGMMEREEVVKSLFTMKYEASEVDGIAFKFLNKGG